MSASSVSILESLPRVSMLVGWLDRSPDGPILSLPIFLNLDLITTSPHFVTNNFPQKISTQSPSSDSTTPSSEHVQSSPLQYPSRDQKPSR